MLLAGSLLYCYIAVDGTSCTAIKEKRRAFGSEKIIIVRIAHRRLGGKLQRRYLGQAENITQAKLAEAQLQAQIEENQSKRDELYSQMEWHELG